MGSILDRARKDVKSILNGGFSTELTITPIDESAVVVNGLGTKHSQSFDTDGLPVIGDNAHCSFYEKDLNDLGVVTRDSKGDLDIKGWKVTWTDNIGTYSYKFSETMPDNTVGLIRIMLSTI